MGSIQEALQHLINGSVTTAVSMTYDTAAEGSWWKTLLQVFFFFVIFIATGKHPGVAGVYGVISSALLIFYGNLPVWGEYVCYALIVMGLAMTLYDLFGKEDR